MTSPPNPQQWALRRYSAFTLIELLTVIGIIAVLMAILLPALGRVQTQARTARTLQQINAISSAIERYKVEQGAYPGPIPNAAFGTTGADATHGGMTMTENMALGIFGGWDPTNPPQAGYVETSVGLGPMSHNINPNKRVRSPVYQDPTPGQFTPPKSGTGWGENGKTATAASNATAYTTAGGTGDTIIPEFVDQFQTPQPILYMRANIGAPGAVTDGSASYPSGATSFQYDVRWLKPYIDLAAKSASNGQADVLVDFPSRNGAPAGWCTYMANPSIANIPRGQNAFVLIDAGADGKYGTKDDLIYP